MKTVALDTNCLLDYFLKRANSIKVKQYIISAIDDKINLYIPLIVILEIEWTLRSYYNYSKEIVIGVIKQLLFIHNCEILNKARVVNAILLYEQTAGVSFGDCIIVLEAIDNKCTDFATSDKKLARLYKKLKK